MVMQSMAERRNWLTAGDKGTLTRGALDAILGSCEDLGDTPRDCAPKVINRIGPFAGMSEPAAKEALLLLEKCEEGQSLAECRPLIEDERYIRNQAIGRAEPNTLAMTQGKTVTWSVKINRTDARVTPGEKKVRLETTPITGEATSAPLPGAITFTRNTCFELEYNPSEFRVEEDRDCPQYRRGAIPYIAEWNVTPLKDGVRELTVAAIHLRGERELTPETVPTSPFKIEVRSKVADWTDKIDLWTQLAIAIGGLITAVMGWGIWKLFKRPKANPPAPPPPAPPQG